MSKPPIEPGEDEVVFELTEQCILDCMGEAHLGDVDTLLLRKKGLRSLEGLSQFNLPNLAAILVSNNAIGPGLAGLESVAFSLTSLNLNNNAVEDISALRSCTALESLFAACNRIRGPCLPSPNLHFRPTRRSRVCWRQTSGPSARAAVSRMSRSLPISSRASRLARTR